MSAKKDKTEAVSTNGKPSGFQDAEECFIIMPISDPDGYEAGHFRRVYEDLFIPACSRAGYKAIRADEVRQTNLIHLDVLQKIIGSPMALCDLSSRNPNVLFELGLRQAFDKPVVLVQEIGTPMIFDINPLRYANYRREMLYRQVIEDQNEIAEAIRETKEAIGSNKSINSIVKLLSLTHGAKLTTISEGEKEPALLQVIMTELSNLRSEVRTLQPRTDNTQSPLVDFRLTYPVVNLKNEIESLLKNLKDAEILSSEVKDLKQYSPLLENIIVSNIQRANELMGYARFNSFTGASHAALGEIKARLHEISLFNRSFNLPSENTQQEQN